MVNINIADGTYAEKLYLRPILAAIAQVNVIGNIAAPGNVIIKPTSNPFSNGVLNGIGCQSYTLYGLTFDGSDPGHSSKECMFFNVSDVDFQNCKCVMADNSNHYAITMFQGQIGLINMSFVMNGTHHAVMWGRFHSFVTSGGTFTLASGTPVFDRGFLFFEKQSLCSMSAITFTGWGAATGPRFWLRDHSQFSTVQTSTTYLPGDADGFCDSTSGYSYGLNNNSAFGCKPMSGAVTTTALPIPGTASLFKDTDGGGVVLAYNDGGTIKSVALT